MRLSPLPIRCKARHPWMMVALSEVNRQDSATPALVEGRAGEDIRNRAEEETRASQVRAQISGVGGGSGTTRRVISRSV